MSKSKLIGSDIESRIIKFLHPYEDIISRWNAELQESLQDPYVQNMLYKRPKRRSPKGKTDLDGVYEFDFKLSKNLSASEVKILIIFSWFVPKELSQFIQIAALNVSKQRRFIDQIDLTIYLKDKTHCLLLLQQQSKITYDSLFGQMRMILRKIESEVEVIPKKNEKSEIIFSLPFFTYRNPLGVNRYSGYTKHYKDSSSLPPAGNHIIKEIQRDRIIQEQYEKARKDYEFDIWSSLQLALGFIY